MGDDTRRPLMDFAALILFTAPMRQGLMRTPIAALTIATLLAACANSSLNTLQFSGASEPFPGNYQAQTALEIKARQLAALGLQVSYPQQVLGQSPFGPRRWYVCVLGVATSKTPPATWPNLTQLAQNALRSTPPAGVFNVILFLHPGQTAGLIEAFDAELCRDAAYEPLFIAG